MPEETILERVCLMQFNKLSSLLIEINRKKCVVGRHLVTGIPSHKDNKLIEEYKRNLHILSYYKEHIEKFLYPHYLIKYEYYVSQSRKYV